MAYSKVCIYCHVVRLEGYNSEERKYYEQGTKQLHTRERCTEAKNRGGGGSTQTPTTTPQEQKTNDIKAAQQERRIQHKQLIQNMQWLTRAIAQLNETQGGAVAKVLLDSMGFEEYQEEQRSYENNVI